MTQTSSIRPPIFVHGDDLYVFDSLEEAEFGLEAVDVEPGEVAYDSEGRLLHVVVRGEIKVTRFGVNQHKARVELVQAEAQPDHAAELRRLLAGWLERAEEPALAIANLAELVERALSLKRGEQRRTARRTRIFGGFVLLVAIVWCVTALRC